MQQKIVFWLPGDTRIKQHLRLRQILSPVLDHLRRKGWGADFAAMLSAPIEASAGDVNIWLATELGEAPPLPGRHILWFLSQMKIMPHTALLAHDAIWTASPDHYRFLQAWIGHLRPIAQMGWPLPKLEKPPAAPRQRGMLLDYTGADRSPNCVRQPTLPADAQELAHVLGQYDVIKTNPILRERMCGFFGFEELVAIAAGCRILGQKRQGLPAALAPFFLEDGAALHAADPTPQEHDALAGYCATCAPAVIAQQMHDTVTNILGATPALPKDPAPSGAAQDSTRISEVDAFFRDAAEVLALWRAIAPTLNHFHLADIAIAAPWASVLSDRSLLDLAPPPWTCLSLTRAILQKIQAGSYQPNADDCNRLRLICDLLQRYSPGLAQRPLPLQDWPTVPWVRVSEECKDRKRDYLVLSRAVNGHNLYRFSQSVVVQKQLSPMILDARADPAPLLSKTGIFLHGFYLDVAQDILQKIHGHLGGCPIFVSTDTAEKRDQLLLILQQIDWKTHRVDVVANRGRDIYPKLFHMAADHAKFEFALHLHTKKSPHSTSLASWGMQTVATLAGDIDRLGQIAQAFQADPSLGMIYANPPSGLHPAISWTRNLRLAEVLAAKLGLPSLPKSQDLDFPVGSMFWARTDALRIVQQGDLDSAYFAPEDAQEDGTLAHALERVLGVACWAGGYGMARCGAQPA